MKKHKLYWLISVLVVTVIFGVIAKVGRVSLSSTLHDPLTYEAVDKAWQVGLAQEANGELKAPFLKKVNVENNLDSFMTVYDKDKKVVSSSGQIDGETPNLPSEYLDNTNAFVRNYFEWEPKPGVQVAGVTVAIGDDGYVLAGRNMQETFRQANRMIKAIAIGWFASILIITVGFVSASRHQKK